MNPSTLLVVLSICAVALSFARDLAKADRKDTRTWRPTLALGAALLLVNSGVEIARRAAESRRQEAAVQSALQSRAQLGEIHEALDALHRETVTALGKLDKRLSALPTTTAAKLRDDAFRLRSELEALRKAVDADRTITADDLSSRIERARRTVGRLDDALEIAIPPTPANRPNPSGGDQVANSEPAAPALITPTGSEQPAASKDPPTLSGTLPTAAIRLGDYESVRCMMLELRTYRDHGMCSFGPSRTERFRAGEQLRLTLGGSANRVLLGLWSGVRDLTIFPEPLVPFVVPKSRRIEFTLLRDVELAGFSVHGGRSPFGQSLGDQNGPASIMSVEARRALR